MFLNRRGSGGGWGKIGPDRRAGGFIVWCFFRFFLASFLRALFCCGFLCLGVSGVPRGTIFGTFYEKNTVSGEKGGPLFLHTLTAFWLDFEGLGPPGGLKKQEKTASKKS